jgi:hypothetical protein
MAPGSVDTPGVRQFPPPTYLEKVVRERTPLGRLVPVEDVANALLMLLSLAAAFITGVVLPVDGGLTAGFVTKDHGADQGWISAPNTRREAALPARTNDSHPMLPSR